VLACPFADMILGELGATVIKIEEPGTGDEARTFEPPVGEESAYFFTCNRGKQSVAMNLRSDAGCDLVRRLAAGADVVVENFPVGALARAGLDAASLRRAHPRLVYVSCTAFGQTGPYAHRKGYDTIFQAMGGVMSLTGERGGPPVKPGLPIADLTSGLWIAIAILAALQGRERSGQGCTIDFSMLDGQVSLLTTAAARYFALGEIPERLGTEHPGRVPSASFVCRDGRRVHLTASDQHWRPLCELLDLGDWGGRTDLRTNAGRVAGRDEVMRVLADAVARIDAGELCRRCEERGVPAGLINDVAEVLHDPHVLARGMVSAFDHPVAGRFPALPLPYKFDGCDGPRLERPPRLGEHTDAVLQTRLGLSADEIASLRQAGAIG
jgi:crotonobetainyl-CoA:carnitine CoA-transferase CaiB-like acyl-CoA transferase